MAEPSIIRVLVPLQPTIIRLIYGQGVPGPVGPVGPPGPPGFARVARTVSAAATLGVADAGLWVDATIGPVVIDLGPAADAVGETVFIQKIDASDNPVSVTATFANAASPWILYGQNVRHEFTPDKTNGVWYA